MRKNTRITRRVSLVFSGSLHQLQLIEQLATVVFDRGESHTHVMADQEEIEQKARADLKRRKPELNIDQFDLVGVLVAIDSKGEEGRIVWMDDEVARDERKLNEKKARAA